jgi:hypothetical protein
MATERLGFFFRGSYDPVIGDREIAAGNRLQGANPSGAITRNN